MLYRIVIDTQKRLTGGNATFAEVFGRIVSRHRSLRAARERADHIPESVIAWAVPGVKVGSWCIGRGWSRIH